jgi:hypothetical protein
LTTNTTTLIIKKYKHIYGEWKCNHGTYIGSDSVDIKMPIYVEWKGCIAIWDKDIS